MVKRANPVKSLKVERQYERQLRKIARHVGDIVGAFPFGDPTAEPAIRHALTQYADIITGWATMAAGQMLHAISVQDEQAWATRAREMSSWLRREIRTAPTGELMRVRLAEQVTLIKSIPLQAAQRVHELTLQGQENATRSHVIAAEIGRTNEVSANRAKLIARTEVARSAALLTEARAVHIGSPGYLWTTSHDSDVRPSHKEMDGVYVRWDTPPTLSDGHTCHAGTIFNCRCFSNVIIPD